MSSFAADKAAGTSALATALAFARRGYGVFPINWPVEKDGRLICSCGSESRGRSCGASAAKHPYGKLAPRGLLSATTESGIVKHWFGYAAPQANLGVVTDRLIVLDVDPRHDGDASLRELEREYGSFPPTWRSFTGGGGEHILFACPDGVEVANFVAETLQEPPLGPGIDVRGRGGYIVAPPSRHISGAPYAWSVDAHPHDLPPAEAPQWLIERLLGKPATLASMPSSAPSPSLAKDPLSPEAWAAFAEDTVAEYRDMAIAKLGGILLRRWVPARLVLTLAQSWNVTHCRPPLADREVVKIVGRIAAAELRRLEREEPPT